MAAGENESARLLLLRAVEIFYTNSDIEGLARTYHMLGEIASVRADHHAALEWIQQALENWRVADNPRGLSDSLSFKGFLHYQIEQLEQALKAFEEAMALDEALGDRPCQAAGYRRMAMVFEKNMEFERARGLYERSLEMEQERDHAEGIARVYHHLGRLEELDEHWEEAEARYRASLKLKQDMWDEPGMAATYHQLGNLQLKRRALDQAAASYKEAMRLEAKLGDGEGRARTQAQLGLVLIEQEAFEEALVELVQAYNILQKLRSPLASEVLTRVEELQERLPTEVFNRIVRSGDAVTRAARDAVDKATETE
jgi:tetratricopeptide (TPR) repeat protein